MRGCKDVCICIYIYIYIYTCLICQDLGQQVCCVCVCCVCVYAYMHQGRIMSCSWYLCTYIHTYIYIYIYIYIYTYIMCVCMYTYMHTYIQTYIRRGLCHIGGRSTSSLGLHTCIHTYIHTYIHQERIMSHRRQAYELIWVCAFGYKFST